MNRVRRAFSLVELLIALTISALLLTACMVALDASFKAYETTTDSASTHVVSRMVMYRALAMIRGGQEFGPYPVGIIKPTRIDSNYVEFVSLENEATGERQVTRLERESDPSAGTGMFKLMFKRWDYVNGTEVNHVEYPILRNLLAANFELEYDRGARLMQATIDMSVRPDDQDPTKIDSELNTPVLRLIASTSPRRLVE